MPQLEGKGLTSVSISILFAQKFFLVGEGLTSGTMLLRRILLLVWLVGVSGRLLVNDDYCDTLDGSDEPSTSACSHLSSSFFPCLSNGRRGVANVSIPTSRINDGTICSHFYKRLCFY